MFVDVMTSKVPAAWWRQDETSGSVMTDASGNARHGTYPNPPAFGAPGLLHDGDASTANTYSTSTVTYGRVSYSPAWMSTPGISLFARIKPAGVTGTQVIAARFGGGSAGFDAWSLRLDGATLRLYINTSSAYLSATLGTVVAGTEYSVGFSYDAGVSRVFLDGSYITSLTGAIYDTATAELAVGRSGYGEPFGGQIDEVAFWSRALADADHADLHSAATAAGAVVHGEPFAVAATMLDGAPVSPVKVPGEAYRSTATMLDGGVVGAQMVVAGEPFATFATMRDGTAASGLVPVVAEVDTFNRANGRTRTGLAEAWVEYDLDTISEREPLRIMAQQMPTPTLVDGRPA